MAWLLERLLWPLAIVLAIALTVVLTRILAETLAVALIRTVLLVLERLVSLTF